MTYGRKEPMWLRIRSLIKKELLAAWRDPKTRFVLLGPPVLQMLVFAYAATQEVKNVRIAVLNQDMGTYARDLVARFEGSTNFRGVDHLTSDAEIAQVINSRKVLLVVHIREDFSRTLAANQQTSIQLIQDGRSSNASQILGGYAQEVVSGYNQELARDKAAPPPASVVVSRIWFNPNLDALWSTVPSLVAILVALEGMMVTGLSVARERELGTFDQLLVSPLSPGEILLGKTAAAFLIGIAEGTLMLNVAVFLFRVPFNGSVLLLYVSMSVFLLAVLGLGLFVSSLAWTQQQAILGTFSLMVPMMLLSGFASPVENMPDWLQVVTLANPIRHFIVIVKGLFLKAMPLSDVLHSLIPLGLIAATTLAGSTRLFRRRAG
jgi:ABC-2 type transport system permease protein